MLSIPGYYADVKRPSEIEVEWYDLKEKKKEEMFWLAINLYST